LHFRRARYLEVYELKTHKDGSTWNEGKAKMERKVVVRWTRG
jgi:hypothetical protein